MGFNPSSTRSIWEMSRLVGRHNFHWLDAWILNEQRKKKKELHPEIWCGYLGPLACLKFIKLAYRDIHIYVYIYIHERSCRCWLHEALQLNPTRILHLNPSPRSGRKSDCIAMVPTTINDQPKPQAGGMKDPHLLPCPVWRAKNVPWDSGPRAIPWLFGIQMLSWENDSQPAKQRLFRAKILRNDKKMPMGNCHGMMIEWFF